VNRFRRNVPNGPFTELRESDCEDSGRLRNTHTSSEGLGSLVDWICRSQNGMLGLSATRLLTTFGLSERLHRQGSA
jgi:hypothetical protein